MPYLFRRPLLAGVLLFVGALVLRRAALGPPRAGAGDISLSADGRAGVLRGTVDGPPQRSGPLTSYWVRADGWRDGPWGEFAPARGRVRVTVPGRPPSVDWGDEALFWGRLRPLRPPAAPGAYDERAVLGERRVFCRLAGKAGGAEALRPLGRVSPLWWVVQARRRFLRALSRMGPEARAVAAGIVIGERPSGLPALQDDFRRSGATHLLVASGTNVAFVLSLWWLLGRWGLCLSRREVLAAGVPFAFFYAYLAGADAPVLRAAVMASAAVGGLLLGRVDRPLHWIGFAALVLLAAEPGALFQAGFQMSFAAVLGLALGMPAWEAGLRRASALCPRPRARWARSGALAAARLLGASVVSQAALAPLLIFYFRRLSLVGPLTNLFAVPWAGLCLFLGAGLFSFDLAGLPGAGAWSFLTEKAVLALWGWSRRMGLLPGAEVPLPWTGTQVFIVGSAVAAGFILLSGVRPGEGDAPPPVGRWRLRGLAAAAAVAAGAAFFPRKPGAFPLVLWPGGAEDAAVAVAADGGGTAVDPVSVGQVRGVLQPFMREEGARLRRLLFTRPPREDWEGFAAAFPDLELLCAFRGAPEACAPWPADGALREPGLAWRREPSGAMGISLGAKNVLLLPAPGAAAPAGPWDVLSVRAVGPAAKLRRDLARFRPGLWLLRGRGGAAWEASAPGPVHRPARDGCFLWRPDGERPRAPDIVK